MTIASLEYERLLIDEKALIEEAVASWEKKTQGKPEHDDCMRLVRTKAQTILRDLSNLRARGYSSERLRSVAEREVVQLNRSALEFCSARNREELAGINAQISKLTFPQVALPSMDCFAIEDMTTALSVGPVRGGPMKSAFASAFHRSPQVEEVAPAQVAETETTPSRLSTFEIMHRNQLVGNMIDAQILSLVPKAVEHVTGVVMDEVISGAKWVGRGIEAGTQKFCSLNDSTQNFCSAIEARVDRVATAVKEDLQEGTKAFLEAHPRLVSHTAKIFDQTTRRIGEVQDNFAASARYNENRYGIPRSMTEQYNQNSLLLPLQFGILAFPFAGRAQPVKKILGETAAKIAAPSLPKPSPVVLKQATIPKSWLGSEHTKAELWVGSYAVVKDEFGHYLSVHVDGLYANGEVGVLNSLITNLANEARVHDVNRAFCVTEVRNSKLKKVLERKYGATAVETGIGRGGKDTLYELSLSKVLGEKPDLTVSDLPLAIRSVRALVQETASAPEPVSALRDAYSGFVAKDYSRYGHTPLGFNEEYLWGKVVSKHPVTVRYHNRNSHYTVAELITQRGREFIVRDSVDETAVLGELTALDFLNSLGLQHMRSPAPIAVGKYTSLGQTRHFLVKTKVPGKTFEKILQEVGESTHPLKRQSMVDHFSGPFREMGRAVGELASKTPLKEPNRFIVDDKIENLVTALETAKIPQNAEVRSIIKAFKENPGRESYFIEDLHSQNCVWSRKTNSFGVFDLDFSGPHNYSFSARIPNDIHQMVEYEGFVAGLELKEIEQLKMAFNEGYREFMSLEPTPAHRFFELFSKVETIESFLDDMTMSSDATDKALKALPEFRKMVKLIIEKK